MASVSTAPRAADRRDDARRRIIDRYDRYDVAAALLQFWWIAVLAWIGLSIWIARSVMIDVAIGR